VSASLIALQRNDLTGGSQQGGKAAATPARQSARGQERACKRDRPAEPEKAAGEGTRGQPAESDAKRIKLKQAETEDFGLGVRPAHGGAREKEGKTSSRRRGASAAAVPASPVAAAAAQPASGSKSAESRGADAAAAGGWVERAKAVVHKAMKHKAGWPFLRPVDPEALELPDYFDVIEDPMDLSTIQNRLNTPTRQGGYSSAQRFADDMRLVFQNALTYNDEGDPVWQAAKTMDAFFEQEWTKMA